MGVASPRGPQGERAPLTSSMSACALVCLRYVR
jgi:hypothetical protein